MKPPANDMTAAGARILSPAEDCHGCKYKTSVYDNGYLYIMNNEGLNDVKMMMTLDTLGESAVSDGHGRRGPNRGLAAVHYGSPPPMPPIGGAALDQT